MSSDGQGICSRCHRRRVLGRFKTCQPCRDYAREVQRELRAAVKKSKG